MGTPTKMPNLPPSRPSFVSSPSQLCLAALLVVLPVGVPLLPQHLGRGGAEEVELEHVVLRVGRAKRPAEGTEKGQTLINSFSKGLNYIFSLLSYFHLNTFSVRVGKVLD